ncbi:MAG: amidohydrolase family protein [Phycisphaerales bacterium]
MSRVNVKAVMCAGVMGLASVTTAQETAPIKEPPSPPKKVALTNARIIPVVGSEIEKGTVLIENGKIAAIGTDVTVPYDAMEVDCAGKVLMPGLIDPHSARGLDVPNENVAVTPFLNVYDAIDPSRLFFEDSLRDGITSVHVIVGNDCVIGGVSRVVRPIGMTVDEMTVAPDVAMKLSTSPKGGFDRMQQMAAMREAFEGLDESLERLAERTYEEKLKKDEKKMDVSVAEARKRGKELIKDEDYDDRQANLVRLRRGDLSGWIYCGEAMDVGPAIRLATDQKIMDKVVFVLGPECYKAAAELKRAKRPVVLDENLYYRERDELTGELKETFVPGVFREAGIPFALQTNPNSSMAERYLTYQAATCVRNGIPRQAALESITLNPAKFLGLEASLGSLEVGKTANIVAFSGDPLDFSSWVELVYIDGIKAYDREKDVRLDELLKLERKVDAREKEKKAAEAAAGEKKDEAGKPADAAGENPKPDAGKEGDGAGPAGERGPGAGGPGRRRQRPSTPPEEKKPESPGTSASGSANEGGTR